ncbi:retrovirus-related Pol polyprotein from transposon 297 [Trichonephila clavipes]|nr:retrovirus-related Pol polyprotein from transposon 297 [Trichonephila clavipes]
MSPELRTNTETSYPELLRKFSGLFTKTDKSTAAKTNVKHRIFTGDHAPINQRAYRVSPTERRIIHEDVQKMLDEGIVQPSESPWSSPIVLTGFARDFTGRECTEMSFGMSCIVGSAKGENPFLNDHLTFSSHPPATAPFHRIGIDLLGDFQTEVDENSEVLIEEIVLRHGAPRVIITDRGAVFRSRLVSLVDLCNIDHRLQRRIIPKQMD